MGRCIMKKEDEFLIFDEFHLINNTGSNLTPEDVMEGLKNVTRTPSENSYHDLSEEE